MRRGRSRSLRSVAGTAAVLALAAATLSACAPPPPPPPEPIAPTAITSGHAVAHEVAGFADTSRTIAGVEWLGGRPLDTDIWYPADRAQAPYPLVIFSHGFGARPTDYWPLLERIASAGYVVAAPLYPVLSGWPYGPSDVEDWDQKFPDTQFVTSAMLFVNTLPGTMGGLIDPARIAAVGHSDGALIAFGDGFGEWHEDGRIRTVVAYAASLWDTGYRPNGRSLLHVLSEYDEFNPFWDSVAWDANIAYPRWTVGLWGADHSGPYFDPGNLAFDVVAGTTINFLDWQLKGASWGPFVVGVEWSGLANFL